MTRLVGGDGRIEVFQFKGPFERSASPRWSLGRSRMTVTSVDVEGGGSGAWFAVDVNGNQVLEAIAPAGEPIHVADGPLFTLGPDDTVSVRMVDGPEVVDLIVVLTMTAKVT